MDARPDLMAWNSLFISVSLKIGKIYFQTADMEQTLASAHKEDRWKWVDENFVREAVDIYIWLLKHPEQKDAALSCSFEYLYAHAKDSPDSPLSPKLIFKGYIEKYLGEDYDKFFP